MTQSLALPAGFGYVWSSESIKWEDYIRNPVHTISCRYRDQTEAPFRFQTCALFDAEDSLVQRYPKLTIRLRAPMEIENLLPYNVKYRIFDKNTSQNWTSYLRQGGVMPVHTVQLDHLVLLNIEAQDTGKPILTST